MNPFDDAWELFLKRQTELGEHHADFPSSQGPVVMYHGKKLTPERRADIQQQGLTPYDTEEAQIGSGRYQQYEGSYDPETGEYLGGGPNVNRWNRDIPANVSVTPSSGTAQDYAWENYRHSDTAEPTTYGVRVGALANQLPLDEPRQRYGARGGLQDNPKFYTGPNTYRFIAGGIDPRALVAMDTDTARAHDVGPVDVLGRPEHRAGEFETHGPTGAYQQSWAAHQANKPPGTNLDSYATPEGKQHMEEGFTGAFTAQEGFIDDALAQWQAEQAAMAAPAQPPADVMPATRQTRLDDMFKSFDEKFDEAWSIIKDFYMSPNQEEEGVGGFFARPQAVSAHMEQGGFEMEDAGRGSSGSSWSRDRGTETMPTIQEPNPPTEAYLPGWTRNRVLPRTVPVNPKDPLQYMRGGSRPQLQPSGAFVGARVGPKTTDSPESIEQLGNTLGHEYTHSLIEPEVDEWARQQHGPLEEQSIEREYSPPPVTARRRSPDDDWDQVGELKENYLGRRRRKFPTPTNQDEIDAERERALLANQAKAFAHEYGAHQSDQSSQEGVDMALRNRSDTHDYWDYLQRQIIDDRWRRGKQWQST